MGNRFYRRSAVINVGGFNKELQVMEDREIQWKLEKAGYKAKGSKDIDVFHVKNKKALELHTALDYAFTYGYNWHKLSHMHPDKTGLTAWPLKITSFVVIFLLSIYFPYFTWVLLTLSLVWLGYNLYHLRTRVSFCLRHMKGTTEKIGAVIIIVFMVILLEIFEELGRTYAVLKP